MQTLFFCSVPTVCSGSDDKTCVCYTQNVDAKPTRDSIKNQTCEVYFNQYQSLVLESHPNKPASVKEQIQSL